MMRTILLTTVLPLALGMRRLLQWRKGLLRFAEQLAPAVATPDIEVGMQNAGLGVVLALKHFEPEAALPGAVFAVWCILTSAGAATYLRRLQHRVAVMIP